MTGAISQQQGDNNPKDTLQSAYMVQTEESQYELSPKGYSAVFGSNHNITHPLQGGTGICFMHRESGSI